MLAIFQKTAEIAKHVARKVAPHVPTICVGLGLTSVVGGMVYACVKTVKVVEAYDEMQEEMDRIEAYPEYSDEQKQEDFRIVRRDFVLNAAKEYLVPGGLVIGGSALIIAGHVTQARRIVALSAAYNGLLTTFEAYRGRVREAEGEAKDMVYLHGEDKEDVEVTTTDKNGNEKTKTKTIATLRHDGENLFYRCFDEYNSREATNSSIYNFDFLKMQERVANDKYHAHGYLFLDEVYEMLGFPLEDGYSHAKLMGWVKGEGDDFVSFGLFDPYDVERSRSNVLDGYGSAPGIWLNFNCDGVIIDKI